MTHADMEAEITVLKEQVKQLRLAASDYEQRFDTLQTPFWKRWWFWLDGWPWHDLNAEKRRWRPWHRQKCGDC